MSLSRKERKGEVFFPSIPSGPERPCKKRAGLYCYTEAGEREGGKVSVAAEKSDKKNWRS